MKKTISILMIITMLTLFASCKAEKEALSLTGEPQLAPANKNESLIADVPIEEPKTEASTTDGKTAEQTTSKEIDEIVSRVLDELKKTTEATTEAVTVPENKTVALNVVTQRGEGTLTFTKVNIIYQYAGLSYGGIKLEYITSDKDAVVPILENSYCKGISGKTYKAGDIGGKDNIGIMSFYGITDFSDLSTVTLTYQFEGFDPVTVTFNIPV